jgi:signal peptidase II
MKRRALKIGLVVLIVLACIGCDQAAKHAARTRLAGRGTVAVIDSVVQLHYVENTGAFLGLGARMPTVVRMAVFIGFPVLVLAGMILYMARRRETAWTMVTGLAFVVGGGCGNLIDRLAHGGRVGDFIFLSAGPLHSGIFNLADLAILLGCLLLLVTPKKKPPRPVQPTP